MKVGDLVTLSAAGKKIQDVERKHASFFRGPGSSYWNLTPQDHKRFKSYWTNDRMVGLVTRVTERTGRTTYDWDRKMYVSTTGVSYFVAWQMNPKPLAETMHTRGHLKFAARGKKNK